MAKISNEDFRGIEDEIRHSELMVKLAAIATRPAESREELAPILVQGISTAEKSLTAIEQSFERNFAALEAIATKENVTDLQPLVDQIREGWTEMLRVLSEQRPTGFRIERDSSNLITRIVAE